MRMSSSDPALLRILDANLNRAREALRVMEEYGRFVLNDVLLTSAIKEARHDLAEAVAGIEGAGSVAAGGLVRSRDIVGDVGREVDAAGEYTRTGAAHVVLSAGKRLSEALRVIEEYGKTFDSTFAGVIEKLRYRGYELERRLTVTAGARDRFASIRLYVIITESLCEGDWFATAEAALRGGADCLQLREKTLPGRELIHRAKRLVDLCHRHDAPCIINDRPDIAVAAGADGVHLGQDDMPVAAARRVLPSACMVGVSTHSIEQVEAAALTVPDYIAVGPMFETPTKPQGHLAGPGALARARQRTSLPLVAIGGINERNVSEVITAADCCICVCSAVIARREVADATSRLKNSMMDSAAIRPQASA